jgi:hypothetical protein
MSTSRREMREASRSLAIAFNIGRVQEALYRTDAGEALEPEEKGLFEQLTRLFTEAGRGLRWAEAAVTEKATDEGSSIDSRALRSLSLVLPVIRNCPTPPPETLALLAEVAAKLGAGEAVDRARRTTFDTVLSDLALRASTKYLGLAESSLCTRKEFHRKSHAWFTRPNDPRPS